MTGPDLVNSLVGVILQFCNHKLITLLLKLKHYMIKLEKWCRWWSSDDSTDIRPGLRKWTWYIPDYICQLYNQKNRKRHL